MAAPVDMNVLFPDEGLELVPNNNGRNAIGLSSIADEGLGAAQVLAVPADVLTD
jgi:hypothetical protein